MLSSTKDRRRDFIPVLDSNRDCRVVGQTLISLTTSAEANNSIRWRQRENDHCRLWCPRMAQSRFLSGGRWPALERGPARARLFVASEPGKGPAAPAGHGLGKLDTVGTARWNLVDSRRSSGGGAHRPMDSASIVSMGIERLSAHSHHRSRPFFVSSALSRMQVMDARHSQRRVTCRPGDRQIDLSMKFANDTVERLALRDDGCARNRHHERACRDGRFISKRRRQAGHPRRQ